MGGWFGGALVTMQVVGEMHSRLEYNLLGSDDHADADAASIAVQATPGWRRSLAQVLVRLSDRIAPELRPVAPARRPGPCFC